jgi:hypothetical protein
LQTLIAFFRRQVLRPRRELPAATTSTTAGSTSSFAATATGANRNSAFAAAGAA